MSRVHIAMAFATTLLIIGIFVFVRSWWGRLIWLAAVAGTVALGYFGLAIQVLMLIGLAIKEVMIKMGSQSAAASLSFTEESGGQIVATDNASGRVMVYGSVDEMPLHIHAQYLKHNSHT
jgi:hypothetical protein